MVLNTAYISSGYSGYVTNDINDVLLLCFFSIFPPTGPIFIKEVETTVISVVDMLRGILKIYKHLTCHSSHGGFKAQQAPFLFGLLGLRQDDQSREEPQ